MNILDEKFNLFVIIIVILNIIALVNGETLLFDGSDYILNIIQKKSIIENHDLRNLAFFLYQFPSYVYVKFIDKDIRIITFLFELSHTFIPLFLLLISRIINKEFSSYHLFLYFVIAGFSSLLRVSELNLAIHFSMIALSCFMLDKQNSNVVLGCILILMSSLCYPFIILLIPLFIALPILNKTYSFKSKMYILFLLFLIAVFIFQHFSIISYIQNYVESSENFFNAIFSTFYFKYYSLVLIYIIAFYIFKKNIKISIFLLLSIICNLLFMNFRIYFHFAGRSLTLVMAIITIYFSILIYTQKKTLNYFIFNLMIIFCSMSLIASFSFNSEKNKFIKYLSQNKGVVDRNKAVKEFKPILYFSSDHALFIYSVLIQDKVESVVNNFIPYSDNEIKKKLKTLIDSGVKINEKNFSRYLD